MKQYLQLLKDVKEKGTYKAPARENMPGTTSLFGYQFRHNLAEGFPLLTTKKMFWKGIVYELLWFLKGDTNIKYLVDNGVNIWNEDAYQYYIKKCKENNIPASDNFEAFVKDIKNNTLDLLENHFPNYTLGDCGYQYGKVWREWNYPEEEGGGYQDQIDGLIKGLKNNPESRRHIVTAIDPIHDTDLALYWCHAMFQFNCRPIEYFEGDGINFGEIGSFYYWIKKPGNLQIGKTMFHFEKIDAISIEEIKQSNKYPAYYLDCQLYQRSADSVLGVPFNIASYALLTHIIAKICNMIPGEFIHSFGDVHIYDNHLDAVNEQLNRTPSELPKLNINTCPNTDWNKSGIDEILKSIEGFEMKTFELIDYNPQSVIKAELSTGIKK